jgi:hypothetical protein
MIKKIVLLILGFSSMFAMHNAELNINQDELEAGVKLDIGQFNHSVEPNTTFIGINHLKASAKNNSIKGDDEDDIDSYVDFNFMIKQSIQNSGFKVGLGVKSVFITSDYVALPLGAEVSYQLPFSSAIPIVLSVSGGYAPKSLSFADAQEYLEYRMMVHFEVMSRASIYAGYRNIDLEGEDDNGNSYDYTYNKSGYFGVKFSF